MLTVALPASNGDGGTVVAFNIKSESEIIREKDLNIQMPCRLSTEMEPAAAAAAAGV